MYYCLPTWQVISYYFIVVLIIVIIWKNIDNLKIDENWLKIDYENLLSSWTDFLIYYSLSE